MIIWKENQIQEKLVSAVKSEFEQLKNQIEQSSMLQKQLTTKLGKLPQYRFLYNSPAMDWVDDLTLLQVLELIDREQLTHLLFSKSGNSFTGFVAYKEDGKKIYGIKIASFYDDQVKSNRTIADDLRGFITDQIASHDIIEWGAEKNNPANNLYMKALPKWFPQLAFFRRWDKNGNRYVYSVSRK
jgi:hypothetical protein